MTLLRKAWGQPDRVLFRGYQLCAAGSGVCFQPGHQGGCQRLVIVKRLGMHQRRPQASERGKELLRMPDPGKGKRGRVVPAHPGLQRCKGGAHVRHIGG